MLEALVRNFDPITRSAGIALALSVLNQCQFSKQYEILSETLAWIFLPILFIGVERIYGKKWPGVLPPFDLKADITSTAPLWTVASSIAVFCFFKAEHGVLELLPLISPILLATEKYLDIELSTSENPSFWGTIWGSGLIAVFAVATLSDWDAFGYAISAIPVIALLVAYVTLTPASGKKSWLLQHFDIEANIVPLSMRVVAVLIITLVVDTAAFGFSTSGLHKALLMALAKALSWYFLIQTTKDSSWGSAAAIGTFGTMSIRNPFKQSSDVRALSHVTTTILVLGQAISMLPKPAKLRMALWAFVAIPLGPYIANIVAIHTQSSPIMHIEHPIENMIRSAKIDFEGMLRKQSDNYTAAYNEYQRRYNADPPPGFEDWYEFVRSHNSSIIDEFDQIYERISPFWKLSGKEVRATIERAQHLPKSELWQCTFSGEHKQTRCRHPSRHSDRGIELSFNRLLGAVPANIPSVTLLVNELDEPMVMRGDGQFNMSDLSRQPTWDSLTKDCPSHDEKMVKPESGSLPFVTNITASTDLCQHPEYQNMHGLFMDPSSFQLFEGLVPILSSGSLSTMGDILYPSPAYIDSALRYTDSHDIAWEEKQNKLYWAGSTTGGFAADNRWKNYQRQRFVKLAQNLERQDHHYLQEKDGVIRQVTSSFLNSRLFDVGFTNVLQCETSICRDQRAYFDIKPWANKDRAFRSQLVFDIDGNGISGRYYRLLASRSTPLKQTLFREWHDERLIPWLHYIPVSQSMEELPELVLYLTSTTAGQESAREVAEWGRDWFSKAFREVDLAIYNYRLLLELARLQDPERPAA